MSQAAKRRIGTGAFVTPLQSRLLYCRLDERKNVIRINFRSSLFLTNIYIQIIFSDFLQFLFISLFSWERFSAREKNENQKRMFSRKDITNDLSINRSQNSFSPNALIRCRNASHTPIHLTVKYFIEKIFQKKNTEFDF
jgi:hypothetical protein